MTHPQPWTEAVRLILYGIIAGALIAAVIGQLVEPHNAGTMLLTGCLLGSAAGLIASFRTRV